MATAFYVKSGKVSEGNATTCAQMPAVPNCGVVGMRLGARISRPAQYTIGAPVPTEQLEQRRKEMSIGLIGR